MAGDGERLKNLIVVVDDDPIVLRSISAGLSGTGFRVAVAQNGAQGLELFLERRNEISLVLADIAMPVMDGLEMVRRMREIDGAVRILLMSGYSESVVGDPAKLRFPLIRKPFLAQDLMRKVGEVMGRSVEPSPAREGERPFQR